MTFRQIALFGGSFDPVHCGHLEIARRARESLGLDQIRFIPCRLSPHKRDEPPAPAHHRVAMLKIALAHVPRTVLDEVELRGDGPSYSYHTVAHFRAAYPDTTLFWILGSDQWKSLPSWKNAEFLAENLEFLVFTRDERPPRSRPGWQMRHLRGEHPASSSAIRDALAQGRDPGESLPSGVAEYIHAHALYQD